MRTRSLECVGDTHVCKWYYCVVPAAIFYLSFGHLNRESHSIVTSRLFSRLAECQELGMGFTY